MFPRTARSKSDLIADIEIDLAGAKKAIEAIPERVARFRVAFKSRTEELAALKLTSLKRKKRLKSCVRRRQGFAEDFARVEDKEVPGIFRSLQAVEEKINQQLKQVFAKFTEEEALFEEDLNEYADYIRQQSQHEYALKEALMNLQSGSAVESVWEGIKPLKKEFIKKRKEICEEVEPYYQSSEKTQTMQEIEELNKALALQLRKHKQLRLQLVNKKKAIQEQKQLWLDWNKLHFRLGQEFKEQSRQLNQEDKESSAILENIGHLIDNLGRLKEQPILLPGIFTPVTRESLELHDNAVSLSYGLLDVFRKIKLLFAGNAKQDPFPEAQQRALSGQKAFVELAATSGEAKGVEQSGMDTVLSCFSELTQQVLKVKDLYEAAFCERLVDVINNGEYWQKKLLFSPVRFDAAPAGIEAMRALIRKGEWRKNAESRQSFLQKIRKIAEARLNDRFCCFFSPPGRDPATSEFYTFLANSGVDMFSIEAVRRAAELGAVKNERANASLRQGFI